MVRAFSCLSSSPDGVGWCSRWRHEGQREWIINGLISVFLLDPRIIVFCARCHETRYLAGFLAERGYSAVGLTGRMRQSDRKRVLDEFIQEEEEDAEGAGRTKILVATDVASRLVGPLCVVSGANSNSLSLVLVSLV